MGGVDAEAVLGAGGCAELFGEADPVAGGSAASGDDDELVASFLELYEGLGVLGVGARGLVEEASAEADGDSHSSSVGLSVFMWLGGLGNGFKVPVSFGWLSGGSRVAKGAGLKIL